jgi:hypothetical protein
MAMRFRGGGVGHTSTRAATNTFLSDRDIIDLEVARDECASEDLGNDFEEEYRDTRGSNEGENNLDEQDHDDWSDIEETYWRQNGDGSESEDLNEDEGPGELADDTLGPDDGEVDDDEVAGLGFAAF